MPCLPIGLANGQLIILNYEIKYDYEKLVDHLVNCLLAYIYTLTRVSVSTHTHTHGYTRRVIISSDQEMHVLVDSRSCAHDFSIN